MNLLTEWKMKRLRGRLGPTAEFRASLRTRLCEASPERFGRRAYGWRFASAGVCAVVLMLGTGTAVYAYESPDVVEGHPLFAVKSKLEVAETKLAATPEQQASVHVKMLERRVTEAERHVEDTPVREKLLKAAEREMDVSENELDGDHLKDFRKREAIVKRVHDSRDRYERIRHRVEQER